ncbi:MAG: cysteine rich repeat-containing protein [Hyphomicrobiales bacterium]|nr:cysteine rich repeat-containing protein [Alphaproteobacteria bacterium]
MFRLVALLFVLLATPALAEKADEMGTPEQRAACSPDVSKFCKSVKSEEGPFAFLACLQKNREKLRPVCLRVIEGGEPLK